VAQRSGRADEGCLGAMPAAGADDENAHG
jgi:hypothetical protein